MTPSDTLFELLDEARQQRQSLHAIQLYMAIMTWCTAIFSGILLIMFAFAISVLR